LKLERGEVKLSCRQLAGWSAAWPIGLQRLFGIRSRTPVYWINALQIERNQTGFHDIFRADDNQASLHKAAVVLLTGYAFDQLAALIEDDHQTLLPQRHTK